MINKRCIYMQMFNDYYAQKNQKNNTQTYIIA